MNQILALKHVRKSYLIDGLSFTLPADGIVGVIGPNGVGKTTLMKMILGEVRPDAGTIRVGDSVRISYVDQMRAGIEPGQTVWEVISGGEAFIRAGRAEIPSRAYVAAFGFKGSGQQKPAGLASGGERGRMNLALTLKQGGNLRGEQGRPARRPGPILREGRREQRLRHGPPRSRSPMPRR